MLKIIIPEREYFDAQSNEFLLLKEQELVLEHSLLSISKWESKWKKPFLSKEPKSPEESIDYIRCMTLNTNLNPYAYLGLSESIFSKISAYVDDSMSATWFNEKQNSSNGKSQVVTSELIYYWMIAFGIPFECQKWHLNRLLTLIRICEIKNTPSKKMKKKDIYAQNRALNASRRSRFGSNG